MDLKDYERAKFELADLLRATVALIGEKRNFERGQPADLLTRLAEDRFNLAVVGRFNRGKSSLMNAILDSERLPTGIIPLTSVITAVSYGSREWVSIEREGFHLAEEISFEALPGYITERGNPANIKRITIANVHLTSEILRRGFYFVDTPGLGSSIVENTRTTERFIPQADAFVLVTSYESPLTEDEMRILQGVASSGIRLFLVVNKHDLVSMDQREQVLEYVAQRVRSIFGDAAPRVFSVSAEQGRLAKRSGDTAALEASGLIELEQSLLAFLLTEKQTRFLLRMCDRVAAILTELPPHPELERRLHSFRATLDTDSPEPAGGVATAHSRFTSCAVCRQIASRMFDAFRHYQYRITIDAVAQAALAQRGGLCALHTWQYEAIASPKGTCLGFPETLEILATKLRAIAEPPELALDAIGKLRPTAKTCLLCRYHRAVERKCLAELAERIRTGRPNDATQGATVCLDHLALLAADVSAPDIVRDLVLDHAHMAERLAEDMRRYALKFDGLRRYLMSDEDRFAAWTGLTLLAGHRNLHAARPAD